MPVADGAHSVLAGWGPDQTIWLGDVTATSDVAERWQRDDDGWRPGAE